MAGKPRARARRKVGRAHRRIAASALAVLIGAAALAAVRGRLLGGVPVPSRTVEVVVPSGRSATVTVSGLEPDRGYTIHAELLGAAPAAANAVRVAFGERPGDIASVLDGAAPASSAEMTASLGGVARLQLRGAGEIGTASRVRVTWQPVPSARMASADFVLSPNQGRRPANCTVTAVVVHSTVIPTLTATVERFLTPSSQVSAHYVVGKDGTVVQMVDDTARAWHAGVSILDGVRGVNDFSVGVEIVNLNDGRDPYTDAQYAAVAAIIRHLREQYALPDARIVSHADVARPVGRKTDPAGFDFPRLYRLIDQPEQATVTEGWW